MGKKTNAILAFSTGIATGAVLGILFAPEKGRETRDKLSFQLEKYRARLLELTNDLIAGREEQGSAAKTEGQRVIKDARDKAERLLVDVDSLINQINNRKEI
ncbi:YtxH domain-containing protein [Rufibacter immobilis]|uniref:YtxH domain-containing protein n=1 Tax=Rufibacter immobilis TaxID=1348778 RepID=A0A3M9MYV3_9BACT|nr:YtxH domain-containing protein [Rufibacter immobilis]RNI30317.1 YtxH domain-containing protein [Rufibacter immobilis]